MKKILLIGKLSDILRNLAEELSGDFNVQLSSFLLDNIKGMVKITRPDMLVISTIGIDYVDTEAFTWIHNNTGNLPIVIISNKESWSIIKTICEGERYQICFPPFSADKLLQECKNIFGIEQELEIFTDLVGDMSELLETTENKRVLVIDDSPIVLRNIKGMLQDIFEVDIATNGEMGIQKAIDKAPDVILLDYEMPGMDGSATFRTLLQLEQTKHIPVIFLTSVSDGKRVKEVIEFHPAGYMLKPPDKSKLIEQINSVIK